MPLSAGGYRIVGDDGFGILALDALTEIHVDDWDHRLQVALSMPLALDGAPFASWVLARLAWFAPPPAEGPLEVVDDALFVWDCLVEDAAGARVAKLQVQGGMVGVGLLGAQARGLGPAVVDALTRALVERPGDVAPVRARVRDPAWSNDPEAYAPTPGPDAFNEYGWDGARFLGANNVRPR